MTERKSAINGDCTVEGMSSELISEGGFDFNNVFFFFFFWGKKMEVMMGGSVIIRKHKPYKMLIS